MKSLFYENYRDKLPLAYRMRPVLLDDFLGQESIVGEGKILKKLIKKKKMVNSIFFGPPGSGKTSLAEIISNEIDFYFENLNATTASTKDIKEIVKKAENRLKIEGKQTLLFLDEIHRFNKLQQDSLLPSTENGVIVLIGATTENPYYSLNSSLLSRCMVLEFEKVSEESIKILLERTLVKINSIFSEEVISYISFVSDGDVRRAYNYLNLIIESEVEDDLEKIKELLGVKKSFYHKEEDKYNTISAYIKSMRGSDPDSAVYWLAKMLTGGEDPVYIARRLIIFASEDIGMANPDAVVMANSALTAAEKIGMPEIRIILSNITIYMAISTKSNSSYSAINEAIKSIDEIGVQEIPKKLIKGFESRYKYPHSFKDSFVEQGYMMERLSFYKPKNNRNENLIKDKLKNLWGWEYE